MRLGTIALSAFAAAWWTVALLFSNGFLLYGTLPFLVALVILVVASLRFAAPRNADDDRERRFRLVGIIVGVGFVMTLASVISLFVSHATDLAASIIASIVGLNVLLLARWLPTKLYYATGVLMLGLGVSSFWIEGAGPRTVFVSIGMALLLAATSFLQLLYAEGWPYPTHDDPKGVD